MKKLLDEETCEVLNELTNLTTIEFEDAIKATPENKRQKLITLLSCGRLYLAMQTVTND